MNLKISNREEDRKILKNYEELCQTLENQNSCKIHEIKIAHEYIDTLEKHLQSMKENQQKLKITIRHLTERNLVLQKEIKERKSAFSLQSSIFLSMVSEIFLTQTNPELVESKKRNFEEDLLKIYDSHSIKTFKENIAKIKQQVDDRFDKKIQNLALQIRDDFTIQLNHELGRNQRLEHELQLQKNRIQVLEKRLNQYQEHNNILQKQLEKTVEENKILKISNKEIEKKTEKDFVRNQNNSINLNTARYSLQKTEKQLHQNLKARENEMKINNLAKQISRQQQEICRLQREKNGFSDEIKNLYLIIEEKNTIIINQKEQLDNKKIMSSRSVSEKSVGNMELEQFLLYVKENIKEFQKIQKEREEFKEKVVILEGTNKLLRQKIIKDLSIIGWSSKKDIEDGGLESNENSTSKGLTSSRRLTTSRTFSHK